MSRTPDHELPDHLRQMRERVEAENERKRLAELEAVYKPDKTWFWKNCRRQRKAGAKICGCCPFRAGIEAAEKAREG